MDNLNTVLKNHNFAKNKSGIGVSSEGYVFSVDRHANSPTLGDLAKKDWYGFDKLIFKDIVCFYEDRNISMRGILYIKDFNQFISSPPKSFFPHLNYVFFDNSIKNLDMWGLCE